MHSSAFSKCFNTRHAKHSRHSAAVSKSPIRYHHEKPGQHQNNELPRPLPGLIRVKENEEQKDDCDRFSRSCECERDNAHPSNDGDCPSDTKIRPFQQAPHDMNGEIDQQKTESNIEE